MTLLEKEAMLADLFRRNKSLIIDPFLRAIKEESIKNITCKFKRSYVTQLATYMSMYYMSCWTQITYLLVSPPRVFLIAFAK